QHQAHSSYSRQSAIAAGSCELHVVIDAGKAGREHIGLETRGIEKVVLKQLTLFVRFGVGLSRQLAVGTVSKPDKTVLQWLWKVNNISALSDRQAILRGQGIWVTRRRRLLCI